MSGSLVCPKNYDVYCRDRRSAAKGVAVRNFVCSVSVHVVDVPAEYWHIEVALYWVVLNAQCRVIKIICVYRKTGFSATA